MLKAIVMLLLCFVLSACDKFSYFHESKWDVPQAELTKKLSVGASTKDAVKAVFGLPHGEHSDIAYVWAERRGDVPGECITETQAQLGAVVPTSDGVGAFGEVYEMWRFNYRDSMRADSCYLSGCTYAVDKATNWFLFNSKGILQSFGKQRTSTFQWGSDPTAADPDSDYCPYVMHQACSDHTLESLRDRGSCQPLQ